MPYKNSSDKKLCMALYRRRKVRQDRLAILSHLGPRCVQCGFDDERALHIDHIQGCGAGRREREALGGSYFATILRKIQAGDQGYQILCANCNAIKKRVMDEVSRKYPL
jgi:hypothetical protein